VILGISPDRPETLRKWKEKLGLPYDLLSDPDHQTLAAYGAWAEKKMYGKTSMGVLRSHFVIDEQGRLLDAQIKVKPEESVQKARDFLLG
jgi:peroxiredoxin Q/BCP